MSSNLLKGGMIGVPAGERRIIDTNALIAERIGALLQEMDQPENEGFTEGLKVEEVDLDALLSDPLEGTQEAEVEIPGISIEEAQEQAMKILQDARDGAAKILQDAMEEGEERARQLREDARREGYEEGVRQAREEYRIREEQLEERRRELEEQYEEMIAQLEPRFVDELSGIYEHLFHVELGGFRDVLLQLIGDCLRGAEGSKNYQIRVSKEDLTYVSSKKNRLLEAVGTGDAELEIVEDPGLEKNACIIRTDNGILDCGLGTQLDELTRKLKLLAYERKG